MMSHRKLDNAHAEWYPGYPSDPQFNAKIHCPICDVVLILTFREKLDDYRQKTGVYVASFIHRDTKEDQPVEIDITTRAFIGTPKYQARMELEDRRRKFKT